MARKKDGLDIDVFRKCLAHFDDGDSPERVNAIRQALKMIEDAAMRFSDACALAYGQTNENLSELQDVIAEQAQRIAAVEARNTQLETENVQLHEGMKAAREELSGRSGDNSRREGGFRGFLTAAWHLAPFRLALLAAVIMMRMSLYIFFESNGGSAPVNLFFACVACFLFVMWSGLEYEQSGVGPVFMRWGLFGAPSLLAVAFLFNGANWRDWFSGPVTNGGGQVVAFALMLLATVLGTSNFADCLCRKAKTSDSRPFAFIRDWFFEKGL